MEDLMSRESALQNAATFTAFELLTKYEYEEVLKVFKQRLLYTQYDSQFLRYFSSHAKHEQRHFEEAFEPLLAASKEDDGNYRQVRSGLKSACFTKHQFLDNVLREAEKKK
jgi:pyrroloquinoline quinone (PQQ) biosynthesis protein C